LERTTPPSWGRRMNLSLGNCSSSLSAQVDLVGNPTSSAQNPDVPWTVRSYCYERILSPLIKFRSRFIRWCAGGHVIAEGCGGEWISAAAPLYFGADNDRTWVLECQALGIRWGCTPAAWFPITTFACLTRGCVTNDKLESNGVNVFKRGRVGSVEFIGRRRRQENLNVLPSHFVLDLVCRSEKQKRKKKQTDLSRSLLPLPVTWLWIKFENGNGSQSYPYKSIIYFVSIPSRN
jgi:hypothetical protein